MPDDLDKLFTYHPPTDETGPKHARIREANEAAALTVVSLIVTVAISTGQPDGAHALVNSATLAFAKVIVDTCPAGSDRDAAVLAVRVARSAGNELIAKIAKHRSAPPDPQVEREVELLAAQFAAELRKARWLANAAIANA